MKEEKDVYFEKEVYGTEIIILFKEIPIIENEDTFPRTHYFKDKECRSITSKFKDELLKLFKVNTLEELKEKMDNKISLMFKENDGKMTYDEKTNRVIVYVNTFKNEVMKPAEEVRKMKSTVGRILNEEKVSSQEFTKLINVVADTIEKQNFTERDLEKITKMIPKLIKNGKIKITLEDVTDINKERLKDIVDLGRDILNKKKSALNKLNITNHDGNSEFVWQKYFEKYVSYLLFGSIETTIPEKELRVKNDLRNADSRLDILTINRYGFLDIVELKKSDKYMFVWDRSHDNFVPSADLNCAISQVNNYLMMLPFDKETGEPIKGAESASGMLVFGSEKYMMKKETIEKYMNCHGVTFESVKLKLRKTLRDLNYSYSHIHIVMYDEILNNLENFLNNMKIEEV